MQKQRESFNTTVSPADIAKRMVGSSEERALCTNILKEVGKGIQSKNLPAMAQEEVLLGMKEAYKDIAQCVVPKSPCIVM